jgi:hypothetical protein
MDRARAKLPTAFLFFPRYSVQVIIFVPMEQHGNKKLKKME